MTRRLLPSAALLGLLTPLLVVLPSAQAVPPDAPKTHAVAPHVMAMDAAVTPRATARFSTLGATWTGPLARGAQVQVRTQRTEGWSDWTTLEVADGGPDQGSLEDTIATRTATEPLWSGPSDGVQTRVLGGPAPAGFRLQLVDPGTSAADADPTGEASGPGVAAAAEVQPTVYTRAQWGADEKLRGYNGTACTRPDYNATVKVGFIHHTDGSNDYAANDVPSIIRGIYAYHVEGEGWCDVGYNFLVDRFGRVWEGRYGGIARPVVGAHTGGFNTDSFGAALIGTFTDAVPPPAMLTAVEQLFAWKLGLTHVDPHGTAVLTSEGGGTSKFAKGVKHTFVDVSGHRDAGSTECPGNQVYSRLGTIRDAIAADMGATIVSPTVTARTGPYGGNPVTVSASVLEQQTWQLDVLKASDGSAVRTFTGTASGPFSVSVDLHDTSGALLPPAGYTLRLTSAAGDDTAVPWSVPFDVLPTSSSPTSTAAPAVSTYVPVTPFRVLDTRTDLAGDQTVGALQPRARTVVQVTGVGSVPSSGVAAVAVNLTAVNIKGPDFLTVYPADAPLPTTSSVNLSNKQTHATLVVPRVGSDGHVSVYNGAGVSDAVLDVVGWYPTSDVTGAPAQGGTTYHAVTPSRIVDTRQSKKPLTNGEVRSYAVAGRAGVPATATAVVVNATVVNTKSAGLLTVYPSSSTRPGVSSLNFVKGEVVANRVISGLSNGAINVYSQVTSGDLLLDVVGWYGGSDGASFSPLTPVRVLDTRIGNGAPRGPVAASSTTLLQVAGRGGVPSDATAVVMTLTATDVTAPGFVSAWPGGPRPATSDVNVAKGFSTSNLVVVGLTGGQLSLFDGGAKLDLLADVLGYYR